MKKFLSALALTFALLGTSLYAQTPEKKECCKKEAMTCNKACTNACATKGEACKCGDNCATPDKQVKADKKKATKSCCKKK